MLILKRGAFALLITLLWTACTKPTQDIKIVVDTNVIKYSALVQVSDAANGTNPPAGLSLAVSGQDAASIYEISGKKNFSVSNGIISLGPAPALAPTADRPVKFTVTLSAPGYTTVTQDIQINTGQNQQVVSISMAKTGTSINAAPIATPTAEATAPVNLNFIGTCASKTNFELHPSIYIFYRIHGSASGYQYLGYMDKGNLTAQLVMGKTYDFQLTYNGVSYMLTQKIEQNSYIKTLDMGDVCNTF
jgi:hypothetical protein